jgi:hypothetical protein
LYIITKQMLIKQVSVSKLVLFQNFNLPKFFFKKQYL